MRGFRTTLILLFLLLATVTGMVRLLRPDLFTNSALSSVVSGVDGAINRAAALPEQTEFGREDPEVEPEGFPDARDDEGQTRPDDRDRYGDRDEDVDDLETAGRLYLVLDDAGHDLDQLRDFGSFPGVFTVAVLPGLDYSREALRMALALGHEAILHQPMEAMGGNDPGPGAIYTAQSEGEIRRTLLSNIASMPGIVGVNNHMGSRATSDARVMGTVVATLERYRIFFLDSRTTHLSVGFATARAAGLSAVQRDVFLDNVRDEEAISAQLDAALEVARNKGYAVMIGHVTSPELARVLTERYPALHAAGFRFFPLSDLIAREQGQLAHAGSGN
jgi:polysaccharide deacetylase 2 family uncharacterized protein YibQ